VGLKREFSEETRQELYNTIDEINDEEWCGFTDWLGDRWYDFQDWVGWLDIQDYTDKIDEYHKKILDKNDTAKEDIDKIFEDVQYVEESYKSIFQSLIETVKEQKNFIDRMSEVIDPAHGAFTTEKINSYLTTDKSAKTEELLILSYMAIIRNGSGDGEYDYDYIRELMQKDPSEISLPMYIALIEIFNEMNDEQKAKFIENSYIYTDGFFLNNNNLYTFDIPHIETSGTWEYGVSDVFKAMVKIYEQRLRDDITPDVLFDNQNNNHLKKLITDFNILYVFATQFNKMYVSGANVSFEGKKGKVNIELKPNMNSNGANDYQIVIHGSDKPYMDNPSTNYRTTSAIDTIIDVFEFGTNLDTELDGCVIRTSETLRVDIGQELALLGIGTLGDVALGFAELEPVTDTILTLSQSALDGINIYIEGMETNAKIDSIKKTLVLGNILTALGCGGSVIMNSEGEYTLNMCFIDPEQLSFHLEAYKYFKGEELEFNLTAEDIIQKTLSGELNDLGNDFDKFIQWYCKQGLTDIKSYAKEIKNNGFGGLYD
jgi:hypothetical protein